MREDGGKQAELQQNRTSQRGQATAGHQHENQQQDRKAATAFTLPELFLISAFSAHLSYLRTIATGSGPPSVVGEKWGGVVRLHRSRTFLGTPPSEEVLGQVQGARLLFAGCWLLGRMLGRRTQEGDTRTQHGEGGWWLTGVITSETTRGREEKEGGGTGRRKGGGGERFAYWYW